MKIRVQFEKIGMIKFIGHLDLLRCIHRALVRAEIPIKYSEGFNPHPKMTFAMALPLGVSSEGEYVDIDVEDVDTSDFLDRINQFLPKGMKVVRIEEVKNKISIVNHVCFAKYKIEMVNGYSKEVLEQKVKAFHEKEEILIEKTSKKKTSTIDIKPLVRELYIEEENGSLYLYFTSSSGNFTNIRTELVFEALEICTEDVSSVHRINLYGECDGALEDLFGYLS